MSNVQHNIKYTVYLYNIVESFQVYIILHLTFYNDSCILYRHWLLRLGLMCKFVKQQQPIGQICDVHAVCCVRIKGVHCWNEKQMLLRNFPDCSIFHLFSLSLRLFLFHILYSELFLYTDSFLLLHFSLYKWTTLKRYSAVLLNELMSRLTLSGATLTQSQLKDETAGGNTVSCSLGCVSLEHI